MQYLVKAQQPSIWSRVKGIFGAGSWYEMPAVDSPYRSTSRESPVAREWHAASSNADEALLPVLGTLRDQSRDLDRNESIARGALENYVTNVVGDGLRPQSRIDHELIGIPEDRARQFERRAEKIFALHMAKNTADFHGKANFATLQAQALRSSMLDGDCLAIRRHRERPGAILPTCVQIVEGARVQNPSIGINPKTDIREGVELDSTGMPVAYHVGKTGVDRFIGSETVRAPRFDSEGVAAVLHLFQQRLPEQSRGEPFLTPVIEKFKQISRYSEAEISAAVINAFFATYVTSEMGGVFGDRSKAHLVRPDDEKPRERKIHKFGPGMMVELLPGEKLDGGSPGRPNANFDAFVQAVLKQIGIGLSIPYEVLTQHFSSSYSAARAAILEAWKVFRVRRAWLVTEFCQPVWEWILTDAIRDGLLEAPGFDDPLKRQAYFAAQWCGTEMEAIDPLKEAKANQTEIETGVKSRRFIVESQGRDYDKQQQEYEEEAKIFKPEFGQQNTPNSRNSKQIQNE
ncbi:MAG: phage portal protein [Pseudobdellovibrionaceae bacterium]|nr:phage portal protein [Pseudobdellovibrionaceae bacterium]